MSPENFCYWLKGFVELNGIESLSKTQVQIVNDHLNLVFDKVTPDRQLKEDPVQRVLKDSRDSWSQLSQGKSKKICSNVIEKAMASLEEKRIQDSIRPEDLYGSGAVKTPFSCSANIYDPTRIVVKEEVAESSDDIESIYGGGCVGTQMTCSSGHDVEKYDLK